jgi:micrococcal nuclease
MRTLTRFVAAVVTAAVVPACSVIASSVARADPVATTATVLKVVDGNTVDIVDDVRGRLRIRLLGIDTPETKKPGYSVGCWGPQASEFAKSTLLGQRVAFVTDPSQGMYDRYGRTLAYLDKADGWDYSVEAARAPSWVEASTSDQLTDAQGHRWEWRSSEMQFVMLDG